MRNKPFTRFLCLVLAVMCLAGGGSVAVGAASADNTNLTDKSIADYKETLNTISYQEYQALNFVGATALPSEVEVALTDNWTFENDDIVITMKGSWTMYVLGKTYASEQDAIDDGCEKELYPVKGKSVRVIEQTYTSLDEVKAAKDKDGNALYDVSELAYVEADRSGRPAVYTPSRGSMTWDISLEDLGIDVATLVSIALDYFPVIAKSSAIEREFYINGVAPYSEARSLRFSKIWSSFQQGSVNGGTKNGLVATYTLQNGDSLSDIVKAAEEAGLEYTVTDDKIITVCQPEVITAKVSSFIETYQLRFFATDINRNEIRPTQLQDPSWTQYVLSDSDGFFHSFTVDGKTYDSNYFGFVVVPDENGNMKLTLDSVNEPMALSTLYFLPYQSPATYSQYYKDAVATVGDKQGSDIIKIEAENTLHTSTNVVYPIEDRTSALCSPVDTTRTVLNTIGTEKWSTAGQWVEYSFSVENSGWYDIYSRFKQSYLDGMYVSRSLEIFTNYDSAEAYQKALNLKHSVGYYNGIPFAEAAGLRYDYGTDWQVTKLTSKGNASDETYQLYFEKGVTYTIRLQVTLGSMSDQVREIERILDTLNTCYLDIIKLTGTTPDDYRSYDFYRVLPDTLRNMVAEKKALEAISQSLRDNAGVASTYTGICDKLVDLLERMVQEGGAPIAKNLDTFKSYVGSLGTFLTDAKTQPMQLDYMMIQPSTAEAPAAAPNFFQALWHEVLSFIQSFFRDYNSMGATEVITDSSKTVSVWVPYGRDQANVIRNLSTNSFTQQTDISVDLKLVAGGTLLPSILAGIGPDVYHGLDDSVVINYAIRGALEPLETMEGFDEALENFNDAATTVLGIADADNDMHYYGLPETQTFSMMFVRLDVLADLNVEIPQTWDDLFEAQTVLQSNNMEIGVTTDYKYFLYQAGGDLWADDGMRINLDSPTGLAAFEKMCNMFTQNSFPYTYDAANRFRTGEMPIILAGYTGLYNQLKVFATELDGCWTFVPVPGTKDENGVIHNEAISSVSSIVMIAGADHKSEAWDYMRWYTGAETQESYANEMVAIIGDSAKHPTANRNALISMPWTYDEYVEVNKQFDNLASVKNYPGYYYIGRYTDFAFLSAYNDGADPSTEILSYINTINTEITRKRQEFKLETLELGQNLAEKRMAQATEAIAVLIDKYNEAPYQDYDNTDLIVAARYAIANASSDPDDYLLLENAAKGFMAVMTEAWEEGGKPTKTITKVNGNEVEVESYFVNISKQTMETADGGYSIDSLSEWELVYFLAEALQDAADAFASY